MAEFEVGDVVCLKSNPEIKLTVRQISGRGNFEVVETAFFNKATNRFEYPKFNPAMLTYFNKID